jgi:hypothetical protein
MWNSGNAARTTSSGWTFEHPSRDVGVHVELDVCQLGALRRPVVPEVNTMTAVSTGSRTASGRRGGAGFEQLV